MSKSKGEHKTCSNPDCNNTFSTNRDWQRFCSKECRIEAWKNKNLSAPIHKMLDNHEERITKLEEKE